jgi:ferredoxin/flavodoxin
MGQGQSYHVIVQEEFQVAKNIIFYFTGTGNSLKLARDIAEVLGDTDIVPMRHGFQVQQPYVRIGFVFPCYAGGAPRIVCSFIKELELLVSTVNTYFFTVVSCNEWGGNSAQMVNSLLAKKGVQLRYADVVPTVGNYIAKYRPEKSFVENSLERTLQRANERSQMVASRIRDKELLSPDKWSFGKAVFYRVGNVYFGVMAKRLTVTDKCVNCGVCAKICPTGNIVASAEKPEFKNKNCSQCMACIQWCPQKAIECGEPTATRNRYHNPDITLEDMLRR